MANYFVVVEPMMQQEISVFETTLSNLQTPVQRVLASTWFVNSPLSPTDLYQLLSLVALPGDRFLVISTNGCEFDNLLATRDTLEACWDAAAR